MGDAASTLSDSLKDLGFEIGRFKTGTPCLLNKRSIDFSKLESQAGYFFFQAEDCIRCIGVTGVQTCALPISGSRPCAGAVSLGRVALARGNSSSGAGARS